MESTIPPPRMFHGNCFDIMADDELIPTGSVNLVLCDPPFGFRLAKFTLPRRTLLGALLVSLLALSAEGASIALGHSHSCALLTDGKVMCWGDNRRGQLGDGTTGSRTTPVEVLNITTATSIALGFRHSCALLTDGKIMCWGDNEDSTQDGNFGQLGDGTTTSSSTVQLRSQTSRQRLASLLVAFTHVLCSQTARLCAGVLIITTATSGTGQPLPLPALLRYLASRQPQASLWDTPTRVPF